MIVTAVLWLFKILSALLFVLTYETKDAKLNVISRNEWNAKLINSTLDDLVLPIKRIIIIHTATNECNTKDECISSIQELQTKHLGPDFQFSDIGYNFLIGGDGNVYEGRGWNYVVYKNKPKGNDDHL